ncbi:MAG TPA: acyl-CoA dehydrogenase family protein [Thermoanaerobaculia bacterium]|jgi:alkylation response protein AidB-like acyl-CoA dehydrogenase|nr:acyl-CoA dehydrogenase family protein [Thermoanaerobaculia bacterium]
MSAVELDPTVDKRSLIDRVAALARERFAPRAAGYDRAAAFPGEDFADLFAAGLHAPTVPAEHGGLGLGPLRGDAWTLWMMTREIARADLSLARCWEGHANSLLLLDAMASPEQQARWFPGVVERGDKWVVWSGEPQARAPGEGRFAGGFGTTLTAVDGGWEVDGTKVFATSAGGADWAILLVNSAGPGGARHTTSPDTLLMLACDLSDPSVETDGSWWDPIGMRATVSHLVRFHRTFIPDGNRIGGPGQYLSGNWQTAFAPHYAASFLGAAEGAYEYALEYLKAQGKTGDPYVQQRAARMSIDVETGHLWLRHVARLWETGRREEAQIAGSRIRHVMEHLAQDTVENAIRACGARALIHPSPIERILRDLSFYIRHDNDDQVLATVGRAVLGQPFDASFYKP